MRQHAGTGLPGKILPYFLYGGSLLLSLGSWTARAEDFRVESSIYVGEATEPVSRSLTIFRAGVTYDHLLADHEITVFDPARRRFVLLDTKREIRADIKMEEIARFCEALRRRVLASKDEFLRFTAAPTLDVSFNDDEGTLTLADPLLKYTAWGEVAPRDRDWGAYQQFMDWYARLNAFTRPGTIPPFPRLELNAALREHNFIPTEVELNIPAQQWLGGEDLTVRSRHILRWRLLDVDKQVLNRTHECLGTFRQVEYTEFRQVRKLDAQANQN